MLTTFIPRRGPSYVKHVSSLWKTVSAAHSTSSTIDANEVSQFTKLSSEWWNEMGQIQPLHNMNKLRVPLVRDGLINTGVIKKEFIDTPKPLKDMCILEVGCGGGILTEPLARLGSNITGIDITPDLLEQATQHAALDPSLSSLKYIMESVEDHANGNSEKYDAVVVSEVLEHVTEKKIFLEACVKCLKPGGSIFITTQNKTTLSWLGAIIFAEYIAGLVPRGTHEWDKFIAPHHTQRILEDYKCRTRIIHGMCFNVFTNSWSWSADTLINYALHAVKD